MPPAEGAVVAPMLRARLLLGPGGLSPLEDGTFRTGDIGRLDADGFLTLVGRRDAMINVGGLKVSPVEVAATLERHPAVTEAAVLGFPDGRDEEVVYFVVSLTSASRARRVRPRRARGTQGARRIEIRDELPRTASGKVRLGVDDLDA